MDKWIDVPLPGFEAITNPAESPSEGEAECQADDKISPETGKSQYWQMILPGFEHFFEEDSITPYIVVVTPC